jgi:hypothetical protein
MKIIQTFEKFVGGNSGYIGYSMSKHAYYARQDGKYPKTDFKKNYKITENSLNILIDAGFINDSEWHHTSKFGNKTIFYSWDEDYYQDIYVENKKEIDKISSDKELNKKETIEKIKKIFDNSDIFKQGEIKKDKQWKKIQNERNLWSIYNTKKLGLDKMISSIDKEINKQFEENLPQNKLSRSNQSGVLFYNHTEDGNTSGIMIEPNRLNNLSWREKYITKSKTDTDIKIKTRINYIKDADIAFDKIDKKLFIEKQKLENQKIKEYENYKNQMKSNENIEIEIDNFTARYYDNYDDEEDENHYEENSIEALKKIQMYENK